SCALHVRASPAGAVQLHTDHVRRHHAGDRPQARGDGADGLSGLPPRLLQPAGRAGRQPRAARVRRLVDPVCRGVPAGAAAGGAYPVSDVYAELAELGVATVFEASGRRGLIDADLERIVPGTRAAGPARTVRCGDGDNLMRWSTLRRRGARPDDAGAEARDADGRDLIATQAKAGVSRR